MNNFMKIDRKISVFWVKYERCISKRSYFISLGYVKLFRDGTKSYQLRLNY